MEEKNTIYDCSRGCLTERAENGELICNYSRGCCKLADFDWLEGISDPKFSNIYEVRFKNTRKGFYENTSHLLLKAGDLVVVEAATGHDVGIITLSGPVVGRQMARNHFDMETKELKKIYRKARPLDLEKWQEAIARENSTMIRARQIAADLGLDMKIGDVEFQGDGTKAIFYYIADERVDFRQLIKVFAEEFRIRIEMKQIGARQEAGLIGGLGVCGRALCCAKFITNFQSISTQAARCQDLSDAHNRIPQVNAPLEFMDGQAWLVKTDVLKGIMWFSYEQGNASKVSPLTVEEVRRIKAANQKGSKPATMLKDTDESEAIDFVSSIGDDSIDRFDKKKKRKKKKRPVRNTGDKEKPNGNKKPERK